jgi:hypothetical protein
MCFATGERGSFDPNGLVRLYCKQKSYGPTGRGAQISKAESLMARALCEID